MIPANRQRNYLQAALYVAIVGVLAAILLHRLLIVAEVAEKASMEASVSNLQSALYTRLAFLVLKGEVARIRDLELRSPFQTAQVAASASYAGEFPGTAPDTVPDETWYFDSLRHELVYRVRYTAHFQANSQAGAKNEVHFRVFVVRSSNGNYKGVELRPVDSHR